MRIAIFHNLPFGGAKRSLYEFAKRLCPAHDVDLFRFDITDESFLDLRNLVKHDYAFAIRGKFLASLRLDLHGPKFFLLPALKQASAEIARQIDSGGYDLTFMHQCIEVNSPFLLRYLQGPSVYFCQQPFRSLEPQFNTGRGVADFAKRLLRQWYARIDDVNLRSASLVLTPSDYCREIVYMKYGVFGRVSQLGVDTEQFRPLGTPKRRCILSVGALGIHKAHELILRSASLIIPKPDVWFVYNWSAPGREQYLKTLADELGVNMQLSANIQEDELVIAYNTAAVTACSSIMEPLGLAALESMSCGTPVVAVREAGYRESVIDRQTGFLVDRNVRDFARALERILNEPDMCSRLGSAARQHVLQSWTLERSYQALEANLYSIVQDRERGNQL
jgi:glycosyltransferase involved in cell wall biosynthesis